jgi:hypothetical protein
VPPLGLDSVSLRSARGRSEASRLARAVPRGTLANPRTTRQLSVRLDYGIACAQRSCSFPFSILESAKMDASIAANVDKLLKLGTPAWGVYVLSRRGFFTLSKNQKTLINRAFYWWGTSVGSIMSRDSVQHLHAKIQRWLRVKHEAFAEALRNRRALHFDVLVLGIVSEEQ